MKRKSKELTVQRNNNNFNATIKIDKGEPSRREIRRYLVSLKLLTFRRLKLIKRRREQSRL